MTGRIVQLLDDQQCGTIAAEDGVDYTFRDRSLIGVTFSALHVGAAVVFAPIEVTRRAEDVRLWSPKSSAAPDITRVR
jgi:hypothetical protein